MLLQMPIWLGLWAAINASVSLRHAALLPVWITDLAAPDRLFSFGDGVSLPLVGVLYGLNLLPLLLAVAMVLQMKMNPQQAAPETDQAKQARMMMYFMPALMLFIFYKMPSGLNLYIMASTFAGVAEQYVIRKHIKAKEEAEAATETTVSAPGKKARGARPKKPKGPFWIKKG
jgi:YidC/Oxa1 family membrane protein insertase